MPTRHQLEDLFRWDANEWLCFGTRSRLLRQQLGQGLFLARARRPVGVQPPAQIPPGDPGPQQPARFVACTPRPILQSADTAPVKHEVKSSQRSALKMSIVVFVGALIPRLLTAGTFVTVDEATWMRRSQRFSDALTNFDLAGMSASLGERATMPGIPTMWLGSIGRVVWGAGKWLGLIDDPWSFDESYKALAVSQIVVGVATAALTALLFYVVLKWAGTTAAVIIGLLAAFEPWVVGLGTILHVDEFSALFGTIALVATCIVLKLPEPVAEVNQKRMSLIAGVAMAGALLSKVSAVGFLFGAAVLVLYAGFRSLKQRDDSPQQLRDLARWLAYAAAAMIVTALVTWPALLVDPNTQISALRTSTGLGSSGHPEFLFGELGFSRWFYIVNVPFRTTPWGLIFLVVGIVGALAQKKTRTTAIALLVGLAPSFYMLSTSTKRAPRYAIVFLLPMFAIAALGLTWPKLRLQRVPAWAGWAFAAIVLINATVVSPYGLAYFNPLVGGSKAAIKDVPVGWGEGINLAGDRIEELAGGSCEGVTTQVGTQRMATTPYGDLHWPCLQPAANGRSTYFVYYVSELQKATALEKRIATRGRTFVESVYLRGIEYAEIWILDSQNDEESTK